MCERVLRSETDFGPNDMEKVPVSLSVCLKFSPTDLSILIQWH